MIERYVRRRNPTLVFRFPRPFLTQILKVSQLGKSLTTGHCQFVLPQLLLPTLILCSLNLSYTDCFFSSLSSLDEGQTWKPSHG